MAQRSLVRIVNRQPGLGDMLQRLAQIAPEDLNALKRLTRDVWIRAETRHKQRFPGGEFQYTKKHLSGW